MAQADLRGPGELNGPVNAVVRVACRHAEWIDATNVLSGVTGSITVHNQSATNLAYDVTGLFL